MSEGGIMLTLADELVLLAIEDDGRIAPAAGQPAFALALLGACLVELSRAGRIDADLARLQIVRDAETGNRALDLLLARLTTAEPRSVGSWLQELRALAPEVGREVLDSLVARQVLEYQEKRLLWARRARRYPIVNGEEQREARSRLLAALEADIPPTPHDAALIGLAAAGGVLKGFLPRTAMGRLQDHLDLYGGLDLIVRATQQAVREDTAARAREIISAAR
jgi:Golgi phosphoprotein 3 (GPP34)